jgi:hypothetical protein
MQAVAAAMHSQCRTDSGECAPTHTEMPNPEDRNVEAKRKAQRRKVQNATELQLPEFPIDRACLFHVDVHASASMGAKRGRGVKPAERGEREALDTWASTESAWMKFVCSSVPCTPGADPGDGPGSSTGTRRYPARSIRQGLP